MKRYILILSLIAFFCVSKAQRIAPTICPSPSKITIDTLNYADISIVTISSESQEAKTWAENHLKTWYGDLSPVVKEDKSRKSSNNSQESYKLSIDKKGVRIEASTLQGVRYALYSLRQLAIPKRGTVKVEGWIAPIAEIEDTPAMEFRGFHICWFPETEACEIERLIRLCAYYKINYVVIESWGTFKSKVAPWFGWPDGEMTIEETHRLCAIARDLGVTLIPEINVFGHATMSRSSSGKHAILDFNPEYQPLFEPSVGWNWCLSNPNTRKVLSDLIVERLEAFDNPPYFHIGCDEAEHPSCPECIKRSYSELLIEHLTAMEKVVSSHGAKAMMWHDMLLDGKDDRWKGFVHNGTKELADALHNFPHSIIICDWYYGGAQNDYPTFRHFKNEGFNVLACPWNDLSGIRSLGQEVKKQSLYGMLGTLWHHYYGFELQGILTTYSNAAWNAKEKLNICSGSIFKNHLRQIGWDMNNRNYYHCGFFDEQVQESPALHD